MQIVYAEELLHPIFYKGESEKERVNDLAVPYFQMSHCSCTYIGVEAYDITSHAILSCIPRNPVASSKSIVNYHSFRR